MAGHLTEAWGKGYKAGLDGSPSSANPFDRGSDLANSWTDGRLEGQRAPRPPAAALQADREVGSS